MDCLKKAMFRHAFSSSLVSLTLTLFLVATATAAKYRDDLPVPFSQIVWDHTNVSGWAITSDMSTVYISGGQINIPHSKACSWPMYDAAVNANAWVIHKSTVDNRWHANTWDFMRQCQTSKGEHDVGWGSKKPYSGQELYFLVSGIARPGYGETVHQRTNIVKYYWHGAAGKALPAAPTCEGLPRINSFTANPNSVFIGEAGMLGSSPYNVELSWNISNGDRVKLVADTGESAESSSHGPVINGLDLYLPKTHTFTLYGINDCTPESKWPKRTITVEAKLPGLPWLQGLILYRGADVATYTPVLDPKGGNERMRGSVNAINKQASASFQYGLNTNYGKEVSATPAMITGENDIPISAIATGLLRGKLYHYRAKAKLRNKISYGADKTFWSDDKPAATSGSFTHHSTDKQKVTVAGTVNPNGAETTVCIQYGTNTSYTEPIVCSGIKLFGSTSQTLTIDLTGLLSTTTYHYRVRGQNDHGYGYGADATFTTFDQPSATTHSASVVTDTGAILNGIVNPNGAATTVYFEYGETTAYGTHVPVVIADPSARTDQVATASIEGLTKGTGYHYRIVGVNNYGTTTDGNKEFKTDTDPVAITDPASGITSSGAILNGRVTSNGDPTTVSCCFVGGQAPICLLVDDDLLVVNGILDEDADDYPVSCDLSWITLDPDTEYSFFIRANNAIGGDDGGEESFTTLTLP